MSSSAPIISTARAPGKTILVGEHAVVYGHPAIATPVWQVAATCQIDAAPAGAGCSIELPDVGLTLSMADEGADHEVLRLARLALDAADAPSNPDWRIVLTSTVPMAGGLGSGAALSAALVKGVWDAAGKQIDSETLSALVYTAEQVYHGAPSGIDNTVIAYGRTLWFVRGKAPEFLRIGAPMTLLIADSGVRSPTLEVVADVRRARDRAPERYDALFAQVAALAHRARTALEEDDAMGLGTLFSANHQLLQEIGVSSPELDALVNAAMQAGALGAKISGGGRGGNMIALVGRERAEGVEAALRTQGAVRVIRTTLSDYTSEPIN